MIRIVIGYELFRITRTRIMMLDDMIRIVIGYELYV